MLLNQAKNDLIENSYLSELDIFNSLKFSFIFNSLTFSLISVLELLIPGALPLSYICNLKKTQKVTESELGKKKTEFKVTESFDFHKGYRISGWYKGKY